MTTSTPASNKPPRPEADCIVDASGLRCPMPVLLAQKQLRIMQAGQVVLVIATDATAETEIPAFCEQAGYALVRSEKSGDVWRFWVCKDN